MNDKIVKKHFFHDMKIDLKGHIRSNNIMETKNVL